MQNNITVLQKLQENLAKDLVVVEENKTVTDERAAEITEAYSKVYDIVVSITKESL